MDESARVRLAKQCLLDLMCGKVPSQEDWGFLFGDPLSTPGLAPSYIQNLKAWARNIAPDPRSKKKPMDQVKIQSLLAEAALNSGRYCLRYAHFPVFSTWTPLTPVSRCLSVFLPVHGPAPPRQRRPPTTNCLQVRKLPRFPPSTPASLDLASLGIWVISLDPRPHGPACELTCSPRALPHSQGFSETRGPRILPLSLSGMGLEEICSRAV